MDDVRLIFLNKRASRCVRKKKERREKKESINSNVEFHSFGWDEPRQRTLGICTSSSEREPRPVALLNIL